jgi:hypothetical protein
MYVGDSYAADAQYKMRGFRHFYRMKKTRPPKTAVVSTSEESAMWFNHLMSALWPNISNYSAVEIKRFMSVFIADTLKASPPPGVKEVYVRNITLGVVPPEIRLLKPYRFSDRPNVYQLDLDLYYKGGMEVTIVAKGCCGFCFSSWLFLNCGCAVGNGAQMKLPITLQEVQVLAPMRFKIEFCHQFPFLKVLFSVRRIVCVYCLRQGARSEFSRSSAKLAFFWHQDCGSVECAELARNQGLGSRCHYGCCQIYYGRAKQDCGEHGRRR